MLGLACNETIVDVALDISCNNLGSQGAHVLESCIHGVRSIATLDISENSEYKSTRNDRKDEVNADRYSSRRYGRGIGVGYNGGQQKQIDSTPPYGA